MKKIIIISAVVVLIAVIIAANLFSGEKGIEVQTEEVFRANITEKVTGNGKIYPVVEVDISAKVSGEILKINAAEGDTVKAGDVLVVLDGDQYRAMRDRAKSSILGARANLKLSESERERTLELYEKQLVSQAEMEVAEAKYQSALSQLQQTQAALEEAQDALNKTVLKAPLSGVIIRKNKEMGEMVLGSQFQADVILGLADLSQMEARVEVNENDIIHVSLNDTSEVEIDAFQDTTFMGIVSEISHSAVTKGVGTIEEVTNYEVKVLLLDKLPSFRPGMSTTADIRTRTAKNVLNIPIQSVTAREREKLEKPSQVESTPADREAEEIKIKKGKGKGTDDLAEVVFVVEEGRAKMKPVKIGISDDNYYEVIDGLQEGEEVIIGPFKVLSRELKNGDPVEIKNRKNEFARAK